MIHARKDFIRARAGMILTDNFPEIINIINQGRKPVDVACRLTDHDHRTELMFPSDLDMMGIEFDVVVFHTVSHDVL